MTAVKSARERLDDVLHYALVAAPFATLLAFLVCSGEDLDTWFHLGIGRWILNHRAVPGLDPFSSTAGMNAYVDSHWLFQIVLYATYSLGRLPLLLALQAACFLGALGLAARSCWRREWAEVFALVFLAVGPIVADRILLRPDMATFLFLGWFWYALYSQRPVNRICLWSLPFVQALWVNIHGLYPLGVALAGCAVGMTVLVGWGLLPKSLAEREDRGISWKEAAAVGLLVLGACLATPYGVEGIKYSLLLYKEIGHGADSFMRDVSELKSPSVVYQRNPPVLLYRFLLGAVIASALLNWRKVRPSAVLALIAFWHLATQSVRNTAYFAIIAAPFILSNLAQWRRDPELPAVARRALRVSLVGLTVWLCWLVASDRYYLHTRDNKRFGLAANPFLSVDGAAAFIEKVDLEGPFLNDILFGGYLIWRWHPERKVFIDGRLEVYGPAFLTDYQRLSQAPEAAWPEFVARHGLEYAILSAMSPYSERLVEFLARSKDWTLVYSDGFASVFARKDGRNRRVVAQTLARRTGAFDVPRPSSSERDPLAALVRGKFAVMIGDENAAREEYQAALAAAPDSIDARINLAALDFRSGRAVEAERGFRLALEQNPREPQILAPLGLVLLSQGRAAEAKTFLERATRLQPDLAQALAGLGAVYYMDGDFARAAETLERAIHFEPNDSTAHFNLGAAYLKLGRVVEARVRFQRALELRPSYAEARAALKR